MATRPTVTEIKGDLHDAAGDLSAHAKAAEAAEAGYIRLAALAVAQAIQFLALAEDLVEDVEEDEERYGEHRGRRPEEGFPF